MRSFSNIRKHFHNIIKLKYLSIQLNEYKKI